VSWIDFIFSASANAATISLGAGALSIHYLFRSEDHLVRAIADPKTGRDAAGTVFRHRQGRPPPGAADGCAISTAKKEIHSITDVKRLKIRVQARRTAIRNGPPSMCWNDG
jgi:TRAP-type C4-dicarboxylate transport system substrate-binding protein